MYMANGYLKKENMRCNAFFKKDRIPDTTQFFIIIKLKLSFLYIWV